MFNSETLLGWWVVVASLDLFMPAFVCVIVGNIMWLLLGTVSLAFWKSLFFFFFAFRIPTWIWFCSQK